MKITLTIADSKASAFIKFIKALDFVTIDSPKTDLEIPEWHQKVIDERLKSVNENPDQLVDWETLKKEFGID